MWEIEAQTTYYGNPGKKPNLRFVAIEDFQRKNAGIPEQALSG